LPTTTLVFSPFYLQSITILIKDNATSEIYQEYYYNKYHEGLVELAKGFLKILLNQPVDKTMVTAVKADVKEG